MDGRFFFNNTAGLLWAARLGMALDDIESLTITALFSGSTRRIFPVLPRSLPAITITLSFLRISTSTYSSISDQSTSGASEIIFMNFFALSSRATGPKIRVPIGSF